MLRRLQCVAKNSGLILFHRETSNLALALHQRQTNFFFGFGTMRGSHVTRGNRNRSANFRNVIAPRHTRVFRAPAYRLGEHGTRFVRAPRKGSDPRKLAPGIGFGKAVV
jgi:hypothetical protein